MTVGRAIQPTPQNSESGAPYFDCAGLLTWEAHDDSVTAVAFSPDGDMLVSGSADSTLKLWNLPYIRTELESVGLRW